MSSLDILGMAVRNLLKRKLRTFLTVLGVVVGTAAIITMISLGLGINRSFTESLSRQGDLTSVNVSPPRDYDMMYSTSGGGMVAMSSGSSSSRSKDPLVIDDAAIETFKRLDGAVTATPFVEISLKAISGKFETWLWIRGMNPEAMEPLGLIPDKGTAIQGTDKYQIVFGYNVPFDFRNPNDRYSGYEWWDSYSGEPDTRTPKINIFEDKIQASYDYVNFGNKNPTYQENQRPVKPITLKVVGWLPTKGEHDYNCYMDIAEVLKIKEAQEKWESGMYQQRGGSGNNRNKSRGYESAIVKFANIDQVQAGMDKIREMGFTAYGMVEQLTSMQEMTNSLQMLLGAIGGVALFVAAIGISNTMIMSIYERTKEIGVMKVIGATLRDIRRLFLLEASMIGFFGGVFGIGLSLIVSAVINNVGISFFEMMVYGNNNSGISYVPPWLCLAALAFAAAIGLLSGFLPARRAMKLSALTAIRTE